MAARMVGDLIGPDAIFVNATGCLQVFTTHNAQSAWQVPWLHSVFANAAAVASGVEAARRGLPGSERVVVQAGDGGTFDIGLQCLSGMIERGHDALFVCYDNEAYMNTGVQRSGSTPHAARTTTSPPGRLSEGKRHLKKDMLAIVAAHHMPYAATASVAFFPDLKAKVEKAMRLRGPRFLHVFSPCPLGWDHDAAASVQVARLAVETGLFPLVELEYGAVTGVMRLAQRRPVEDYLRLQGRFKHLFKDAHGAAELRHLQALADANIRRYGLLDATTAWDTGEAGRAQRGGRGGYAPAHGAAS
ncbi:MAG: thiamine pyrophosphate-dependent enzyme [Pseudomonadota bacterium]|nr:thiamine pyrophosphate-dependent enzyme [Pseudomonadota bacterium]